MKISRVQTKSNKFTINQSSMNHVFDISAKLRKVVEKKHISHKVSWKDNPSFRSVFVQTGRSKIHPRLDQ